MNILQEFDTIAAIATPIGTGGVGIIRISGDESFNIIDKISDIKTFPIGKICHGWIVDGDKKIDEVVVLPFKKPHSYTGEDVIEIQCHGGMNVLRNILDLVYKNNSRPAEKGEFTKRAFLNKKLDLTQAEAVGDLIHAKTSQFAIKSAQNLSGTLSTKIKELRSKLFEISSRIVAGIDFPEDVEEPSYEYLISGFEEIIYEIKRILSCAKSSDILRQGISTAIVGRPNVGKSSIFNSLLNLDRAIVTDIAGTTRDIIKENVDIGVSLTLVDTAGIRENNNIDKVEQIGIEYSKKSVRDADLVIFVYDALEGFTSEDEKIYDEIKDKSHIVVANKIDLLAKEDIRTILQNTVLASTKTKEGFDELREKIKQTVYELSPEDTEFVTNSRQQACLRQSLENLEKALIASKQNQLQDMIYIDVKSALLNLDEFSGEIVSEEILDNIFSHFCIGK